MWKCQMSKNKRVFVVDDESSFILRFQIVTKRVGIPMEEFHWYKNSQDFLYEYHGFRGNGANNIVFLDINMRSFGANGFEVLREMRSVSNGDPIISIITSSAVRSEVTRAKLLKADAYIVKSGHLDTFEDRIRRFKEQFIDHGRRQFTVFGEREII